MGIYRVVKRDKYFVENELREVPPGALIEIETRELATQLISQGKIARWERSAKKQKNQIALAQQRAWTKRVGIWLATSHHYSGGRIHLWQFAWTMAQAGCEVWLITDGLPKWRRDYPECERLRVVQEDAFSPPEDLDLIISDNKGQLGQKALNYKRDHPEIPMIGFNFETPNWVAEYVPEYASRLTGTAPKSLYEAADYLMANSRISGEYLLRWIGKDTPVGILPPAINEFALEKSLTENAVDIERPYAMMSARSADFKSVDLAARAIIELPMPFDLVLIGSSRTSVQPNENHIIHHKGAVTDAMKYRLMRDAAIVLAPSLFEGFGMVPAESLSSGTPIIVYDLPVLREEYGDKPGMLYAKWNDGEDFKAQVRTCAQQRHELKQRARDNAENIRTGYGLSKMAERVENLPYFGCKRPRISVQLVAYWGYSRESIEAIYPYVDEIFVAFGPTEHAAKVNDGSLARLYDTPDPDKKIKLEAREKWRDKIDMRRWCYRQATGNYMLLLDGDEIWLGLDKWIESGLKFGCPRWINFWHDLGHWVYDAGGKARWGRQIDGRGSECPHYRWSWWRKSYAFRAHPAAVDAGDNVLHIIGNDAARHVPGCEIYHLGHCLPKPLMQIKHEYYLHRDGQDAGRFKRRDAWHNWTGGIGDQGDGIIARVGWDVPEIVKRAYQDMQTWEIR